MEIRTALYFHHYVGTYIFLAGSSITAGGGSNTVLESGANPCNVSRRVHDSATLNGDHFAGTVIAGSSATVGANDILIGRAVALTGAVTMPANGGTTFGGCCGAVPPPGGVSTLTIALSNANATDTLLTSALTDTLLGGVVIALVD